jgi:hypothetical protein
MDSAQIMWLEVISFFDGNTIASAIVLHESLNFHSVCKSYPNTDFPVSSGFRTVNGLGSMPTVLGIKSLETD